MIYRKPLLYAGAALFALLPVTGLHAQFSAASPAPAATAPMAFDHTLGSRTVDGGTYTVAATQPADSTLKSQRVRFTSITPTGAGTQTRYFIINTGKYKTVAQLNAYLREAFEKFLAGAPVNTEVGKVGDIKYGGEVRFVVQSPDVLRYDTLAEGGAPSSMTLPRAEVAAYVAILSGK